MWALLSLSVILTVTVGATEDGSGYSSVRNAFTRFGIVPQVIPEAPDNKLMVIVGNYMVNLGNDIPAFATIIDPLESWIADNNTYYTIINFDADYPQVFENNCTQYLHGMLVNIPGANVQQGDRLAPYVAAFSLPGTGYHRYIGLVYRQQRRIPVTIDLLISISTNFGNFSLNDFVRRYRLGPPIFGNFFRSDLPLCLPTKRSKGYCVVN